MDKLLRKVVFDRIERLQNNVKEGEKYAYFNLTEEIVDMIGTFTLKAIFGDPNVNLADRETVMIYVKGVQKLMPFS